MQVDLFVLIHTALDRGGCEAILRSPPLLYMSHVDASKEGLDTSLQKRTSPPTIHWLIEIYSTAALISSRLVPRLTPQHVSLWPAHTFLVAEYYLVSIR